MNRKAAIHNGLENIAREMLGFIQESEHSFVNRWVPATYIKKELDLLVLCYPKGGEQHGKKGWLFSILARMLEDQGMLKYKKVGKHAYYQVCNS
jgi:hypothetical protein